MNIKEISETFKNALLGGYKVRIYGIGKKANYDSALWWYENGKPFTSCRELGTFERDFDLAEMVARLVGLVQDGFCADIVE